jgi:zinc transporter 2
MNIDSAMLHVIGDCIQSVGVIIAAVIIYFEPRAWYCDPICTYIFAVLVMITTIPITKRCLKILMEGTPEEFNVKQLSEDIWALNSGETKNIVDIHDLHIWSIASGKNAMTVHIKSHHPLQTLSEVTDLCRRKYQLYHTVIQVEGDNDTDINPHGFECDNDIHD